MLLLIFVETLDMFFPVQITIYMYCEISNTGYLLYFYSIDNNFYFKCNLLMGWMENNKICLSILRDNLLQLNQPVTFFIF